MFDCHFSIRLDHRDSRDNGNSVADWLREEADALGVDKFCGIVQSPESYLNSLDHLPIADDERAQIAGENLLALVA